ncbi:P-loop containing nucleoside triphosphate hydrolase protein, partial [Pavlovales sp. CCMP2436]
IGLLNAVRSLCFNVAMRQIGMSLRKALFNQIVSQDMVFFDSMKTGDLISRLSGNIGSMLSPLQSTLQTLLSNAILLVGSLVMCFVISWRLSMLAFTTLAPIIYMTSAYARWSRRQNYMIWQTLGDANADAAEVMSNMRLVHGTSRSPPYYLHADPPPLKTQINLNKPTDGTLTVTLGDYLDQGASVIILWCGGATAMTPGSTLSVGRLITYTLYYNRIQNSYNSLNGVLNSFTRSAGAAMRVLSLFDLEPSIPSTLLTGGPHDAISVRFEDISFHYQMRPDAPVLSGLSLDVASGTVTALVGKSGAGKSTAIGLLLRFYDVKGGRVLINGLDLRSLNLQSFHAAIGVVTQETQLFNASIEDNIAYGLASYTQEQMIAAARQAQAHDFILSLPDGYRTRVGERGTRLSGGQKQRIAICRALLRSPRLLVLDEATSSLDASAEAEVQASLDALIWTGEHTVILIAHRLSTVVNATQIALLENGKVAELGKHNDLVARGGRYAELVSKQLQQQREVIPE